MNGVNVGVDMEEMLCLSHYRLLNFNALILENSLHSSLLTTQTYFKSLFSMLL